VVPNPVIYFVNTGLFQLSHGIVKGSDSLELFGEFGCSDVNSHCHSCVQLFMQLFKLTYLAELN